MSRRAAQDFADALNVVLNRTVSDARLSVRRIIGSPGIFQLTRTVDGDDAPLELRGSELRLFVEYVVVVEGEDLGIDSYSYRLQRDVSSRSWLVRWEYRREPRTVDYAYPRAHVHVNGTLPDRRPVDRTHIATRKMPLELIVRNLITDWGVRPRTDDWEAILEESANSTGQEHH